MDTLTDRQARELEYHREHFKTAKDVSFDVLDNPGKRWWNAYWAMFALLGRMEGKRVLVVGCGAGEDALRLAKMGAQVYACDISPEAIAIGRVLADRYGLRVNFDAMPAENMTYRDALFDYVFARDILHHVDIPKALAEMRRVSKPGAIWIVDEIYSHSWTDAIRNSWLVRRLLYPLMQRFVYGSDKPYITQDERKMSEHDIAAVKALLGNPRSRYFNFIVTRLIPDKWDWAAKVDFWLLRALHPLAKYLGGRLLLIGAVK